MRKSWILHAFNSVLDSPTVLLVAQGDRVIYFIVFPNFSLGITRCQEVGIQKQGMEARRPCPSGERGLKRCLVRTFTVLRWGLGEPGRRRESRERLNKSFWKTEYTRFGGYLDGGVEGMEASTWLAESASSCVSRGHGRSSFVEMTWGVWLLHMLSQTRRTWK